MLGKAKALRKAKTWLKQLKEDMERESVPQMKGTPNCCSKPIEQTTRKRK